MTASALGSLIALVAIGAALGLDGAGIGVCCVAALTGLGLRRTSATSAIATALTPPALWLLTALAVGLALAPPPIRWTGIVGDDLLVLRPRELLLVAPRTGDVRWRTPLPPGEQGIWRRGDDLLLARHGALLCVDTRDGRPRWRRRLGHVAVCRDAGPLLVTQPGRIICLDPASGATRWEQLIGTAELGLEEVDDLLVIDNRWVIRAVGKLTGGERWTRKSSDLRLRLGRAGLGSKGGNPRADYYQRELVDLRTGASVAIHHGLTEHELSLSPRERWLVRLRPTHMTLWDLDYGLRARHYTLAPLVANPPGHITLRDGRAALWFAYEHGPPRARRVALRCVDLERLTTDAARARLEDIPLDDDAPWKRLELRDAPDGEGDLTLRLTRGRRERLIHVRDGQLRRRPWRPIGNDQLTPWKHFAPQVVRASTPTAAPDGVRHAGGRVLRFERRRLAAAFAPRATAPDLARWALIAATLLALAARPGPSTTLALALVALLLTVVGRGWSLAPRTLVALVTTAALAAATASALALRATPPRDRTRGALLLGPPLLALGWLAARLPDMSWLLAP